jgi:O-glycosyl hydrolase
MSVFSRSIPATAALCAAVLAIGACASNDHDPMSPMTAGQRAGMSGTRSTGASTAAFTAAPSQVIKGWGIYPASGTGAFWQKPAIQTAVYAMGATMVRDRLDPALYVSGSTMSNMVINQTLLQGYITKIQAAKAAGVTGYMLTVWSPPAAFKTNNSIDGDSAGNVGTLRASSEPAFVAFLTTVIKALQLSAIGAPLTLSVQNEPEKLVTYAGATYTPALWQQVIQDTRTSFDGNGLAAITLFGPETGQYTPAIYSNYMTDAPGYLGGPNYPALANASMDHAVGAYAFHTYAECSLTQTAAAMQAHPKEAWMTEYSAPLGSTELAWTLDMMSAMAAHVVIIPFSYWFWWDSYTPSTAAPDGGDLITGQSTPIYSKRYFALQKLWTTVRPGWHVQAMTSTDTDLPTGAGTQDPCAARVKLMSYVNAVGDSAVVQIVNTTTTNKTVQVAGLVGTVQKSFRTDATNDMVAQQVTNIYHGYSTVSVPANSVVLAIMY